MSSYQQKQPTVVPQVIPNEHQVKQPCQPPPQQPSVPCEPVVITNPGQTKVPQTGIKVPISEPVKTTNPQPVNPQVPQPGIKVPVTQPVNPQNPQPVNPQVPQPGINVPQPGYTKVPVAPTPVVTPGPGQQKTKQK